MTTLIEVIKKVREQNLTKTELENYFDEISVLLAEMLIEASELEKDEALFLASREQGESVISKKVEFKATAGGQRLIVLKRYISATKTLLASIKNRIYSNL